MIEILSQITDTINNITISDIILWFAYSLFGLILFLFVMVNKNFGIQRTAQIIGTLLDFIDNKLADHIKRADINVINIWGYLFMLWVIPAMLWVLFYTFWVLLSILFGPASFAFYMITFFYTPK